MSSSKRSRSRSDVGSSEGTSQESPVTKTFANSGQSNWNEQDEAATLAQRDQKDGRTLVSSSSEGSPAKTSASPDEGEASEATAAPSSGRSSASSQPALFGPEQSFSRMSPASFPLAAVADADDVARFYAGISDEVAQGLKAALLATTDIPSEAPELSERVRRAASLAKLGKGIAAQILQWSAPRWGSSGIASATEFSTADTSEFPRDGGASTSSLSDVLEPRVDRRYYLSPRAARGILSRADKRGRVLPKQLRAALEDLAEQE